MNLSILRNKFKFLKSDIYIWFYPYDSSQKLLSKKEIKIAQSLSLRSRKQFQFSRGCARMALSIARITIELREILLKDRPTSLFEISPKGTVPVLRTADKTFEESMDIIYWALDNSNKLEVFFDNKETQKKLKSLTK